MDRIHFHNLASSYTSTVYNSGAWIDGAKMRELEEKLKEYLGVKYVVLTNSGTSALLAAFWVLKTEFSSITTCPYTWPASYQSARVLNMETRFRRFLLKESAEFSSVSLNVLVHLFGQPSELLRTIGDKPFIEDASQAFGAKFQGKPVGTFGRMGCYSFYPTKVLHTCGHAGAISTDNEEYYRELKIFVNGGRHDGKASAAIALNLRMDEIKAEFLLFELKELESRIEMQRSIAQEFISGIPVEQPFLVERPGDRHTYATCNLLIERRDEFRAFMDELGIDTLIHYGEEILPVPERNTYSDITSSVVAIPCRWNLKKEEIKRIRTALQKWFG